MPDAPTLPQLELRVLDLVRDEVLQTPPGFGVSSDLFEAGLDSMAIMQLLLLLEEHYGVAIPVGSVSRANFRSAQTIGALLVQQGYVVTEGGVVEEPAPVIASEPAVSPEVVETTPKEIVPEPKLDRLPLRDCDFFTHAFDEMLRHAGQGGHIARSFIELDRVPDVQAIRDLLVKLPDQFPFPIFTAKLEKPSFFSLHTWVPARYQRPLELNLWSDERSSGGLIAHGAQKFADLQTKLDDIINTSLPQYDDGWMNVRFDLVEKEDGTCVFVFSWSHLIMDGIGAEFFLLEMNRLLGGKSEPVPAFDLTDFKDTRGWGERWKTAKVMPAFFDTVMKHPFEALGSEKLSSGRAHFQVITLTEEQSAEVARRSAEVSGPLINMPFHLACAMRAHQAVFDFRKQKPESLMCCVPIQVRKKGTRGPLFQNHLTMFFCNLLAEELTTLDAAAGSLHKQHTRFIKEKIGDAFRDLMWMMRPMPPSLHMHFINWHMKGKFSSFYHSNTGVFAPELTQFAGASVTNAYHVPSFSDPPGTGVFTNEKNGRLVLTLCWREGTLTPEEREIFIQQLLSDLGVRS
ncbi:Phosphopantetheine attachment site [Prosthecobacter debontii]|uniref:Phosphopantetheine attachment site n=1 Tax=Prosthecobacter debontii TaxID=48467 RepID=A0A1T4WV07_9BACT|nr:acyl carrier protein [Prosthecobacter debontii]SKA81210.1 Phosphopantetheine attachment site [Prosthecobacter debontii]